MTSWYGPSLSGSARGWIVTTPQRKNDPHYGGHTWKLTVLHYNKIMLIYLYPFLLVITQFFTCIICIIDCICILTGSPGYYFFMIVYVIRKIESNKNSPNYLNVMVIYHYHGTEHDNYLVITIYTRFQTQQLQG